ncbi:aminotransferase class I/II-fold pyridoxal phosphate-dependent enzyme [Paraliomyxa miuraensis]|uniref:aminotransferase class I/II-fold pyridoxal phosphate-dependent enzyme n=1 Tax=Paraliomyxa miuraensis TaxID=376150 RepID=UPI002256FAFD|nr:aminotransferase class I/II-fold pyridoxal phosphate-dependent enzyme [Paraliomyxa miuraensis]MCX4244058.1 aminotransferase class I/II-fold pyridoxal phosphate-dependent enzyme [Paraliomyxa miuraensis]
MDATQRARQRLAELDAAGLLRRCPSVDHRRGVRYELDGRPVVGLCSNDYLGLAGDPRLAVDPSSSAGAGASRLICGDLPEHRDLERRLAALARTEDAVLFPSGFQLNVGVLPTLLEPHDRVDSDALNHASLIDGMRLSPARVTILEHARSPVTHPHPVPQPHARPADARAIHWWITESIFSMDGDRLELDAARRHLDRGAAMYVDEAHALGLFDGGQGWLGHHGIQPTVLVGTLSKALGCAGAFLGASGPLCALVRNRARSFVFSTGTSPALATRIGQALAIVTGPEGDGLRERLWSNTRRLAEALGLPDADDPPSPILPVLIGDNARAVGLAHALLELGWHVQAIRPPTVPAGTARLRITVSAAHEPEQLLAFADALLELLAREGVPLRIERGAARSSASPALPTLARRPA